MQAMLCSESVWFCKDSPHSSARLRKRRTEKGLENTAGIPKPWASWSCLVQALSLLSSSGSYGAGWVRILDSVPAGPCQAGHCRCTQGIQANLVPPAPSSGSQRPQPQDTASGALQEHAELLILRGSLCEEGLALSKLSRTSSRGLGM